MVSSDRNCERAANVQKHNEGFPKALGRPRGVHNMVSTEVNGHLQLLYNHPDFIFKPVLLLPTNLLTTKGSERTLDCL